MKKEYYFNNNGQKINSKFNMIFEAVMSENGLLNGIKRDPTLFILNEDINVITEEICAPHYVISESTGDVLLFEDVMFWDRKQLISEGILSEVFEVGEKIYNSIIEGLKKLITMAGDAIKAWLEKIKESAVVKKIREKFGLDSKFSVDKFKGMIKVVDKNGKESSGEEVTAEAVELRDDSSLIFEDRKSDARLSKKQAEMDVDALKQEIKRYQEYKKPVAVKQKKKKKDGSVTDEFVQKLQNKAGKAIGPKYKEGMLDLLQKRIAELNAKGEAAADKPGEGAMANAPKKQIKKKVKVGDNTSKVVVLSDYVMNLPVNVLEYELGRYMRALTGEKPIISKKTQKPMSVWYLTTMRDLINIRIKQLKETAKENGEPIKNVESTVAPQDLAQRSEEAAKNSDPNSPPPAATANPASASDAASGNANVPASENGEKKDVVGTVTVESEQASKVVDEGTQQVSQELSQTAKAEEDGDKNADAVQPAQDGQSSEQSDGKEKKSLWKRFTGKVKSAFEGVKNWLKSHKWVQYVVYAAIIIVVGLVIWQIFVPAIYGILHGGLINGLSGTFRLVTAGMTYYSTFKAGKNAIKTGQGWGKFIMLIIGSIFATCTVVQLAQVGKQMMQAAASVNSGEAAASSEGTTGEAAKGLPGHKGWGVGDTYTSKDGTTWELTEIKPGMGPRGMYKFVGTTVDGTKVEHICDAATALHDPSSVTRLLNNEIYVDSSKVMKGATATDF